MLHPENILLISDDPHQSSTLLDLLCAKTRQPIHITTIDDLAQLSRSYIEGRFDVILFDTELFSQTHQCYEWIRKLQEWEKSLPAIVLFAQEDEREVMRALSQGVQDYLIKDHYSAEVVSRVVRYAIQRKRYEEKIAHLTMQDHLTSLMSGEMIPSSLRQAIASARREQSLLAVYYVDIDNFRPVNELHGHDVGNALLIDIAARLRDILDENSILARLSADTFVIIDIAEDLDGCAVLAEEIISGMQVSTTIAGIELHISTSIGVATYPQCATNPTDLMTYAQLALDRAKQEGGHSYRFFSQELNAEATRRIHITSALKNMADDDMFQLHYQPKIDLTSMCITGVEALIRWTHPTYGNIPPDQFIPLAEEAGLIHHVSNWVAQTACTQQRHEPFCHLEMCINVSAREMCDDDIVHMIRHVLQETHIPPHQLILELTETGMLSDTKVALQVMHQLKDLGIKLYLDDFGTGYSSIDYLRRYPIDALKIDRSFVSHMHQQSEDVRMVRLIIDIARELNLRVIAEGIEQPQQLDLLREMQCHEGQGYHICKPLAAEQLMLWLNNTPHGICTMPGGT